MFRFVWDKVNKMERPLKKKMPWDGIGNECEVTMKENRDKINLSRNKEEINNCKNIEFIIKMPTMK